MLVNVYGAKSQGIDAVKVTVEVDIRTGIGIHLVGLGDTAVKESLLRTVNALQALGFHIPGKKIVINLAPADQHKKGSGYDLPIALGIIAASEQERLESIGEFLVMGELGLDGSVRDIEGALSFAELSRACGFEGCILPVRSALEAVDVDGVRVYGVRSIMDALRIIKSPPGECEDLLITNSPEYHELMADCSRQQRRVDYMDFSEIIGQETAKRGVEIACAGGHNVVLIGAPGSGKSSIAKAMAGILPPMTREESLVTTKIYSVAGKGDLTKGLITQRPMRSPHYSVSLAAMIGGGSGDFLQPGEVSLANAGILFVDEFNQMPKSVIEALRGPLEDRKVTLSRLRSKVEYPASFMLVAASNPCPCGYWGEGERCTCTPGQRLAYLSRLSGPILDRIDIQLWLHPVDPAKLVGRVAEESSASIAARVVEARRVQQERFKGEPSVNTNSEMSSKMLEEYCPLTRECRDLLQRIMTSMQLSARSYSRIIKVARTIADLAHSEEILPMHIAEAASYRSLDKPPTM